MSCSRPGTDWQLGCMELKQRGSHLLQSGQWSDCTFLLGSHLNRATFKAHKLILACASPVFEAMFFGGIAEKDAPIEIWDVQPEAFQTLLEYIYTDKAVINTFERACSVYYGAKKYMLPYLEKECTWYLSLNLSPQNVCRAFELAQLFDEQLLMDKCIQVMTNRTTAVINENNFKEVEMSTLLTLLSQDNLNIVSELDLFKAIEKYANIHPGEKRRLDSFDTEIGSPSKKVKRDSIEMGDALNKMFETSQEAMQIEIKYNVKSQELKELESKCNETTKEASKINNESSETTKEASETIKETSQTIKEASQTIKETSQTIKETSQTIKEASQTEFKSESTGSGIVDSPQAKGLETQAGPVLTVKESFDANNNDTYYDANDIAALGARVALREAVCKIRFLTLTARQFADGPARSALLTESEAFAVLMNILSSQPSVPMPKDFSTSRVSRNQQTLYQEKTDSNSEVLFRFTVLNFKTRRRSVESRPFSFLDMHWNVKLVPRFETDTGRLDFKCFGLYIKCLGKAEPGSAWSATVRASVKIVPQAPARPAVAADLRRTFTNKENVWGFERFVSWNDIMDPTRGLVKGNALAIETHLIAE